MTEERIALLTTKGFRRWQKGNLDRLYINAAQLGLSCEYYGTGNIRSAEFQGNRISNSEGYRMKTAKTYVDVKTGKVYNATLKAAAEELIETKGE